MSKIKFGKIIKCALGNAVKVGHTAKKGEQEYKHRFVSQHFFSKESQDFYKS